MSSKNNEKSNELRAEGNKLYSQRKFFDSMLKYNESLSFAQPGSEHIGLAYANRSAVYLEMKLHEKCLKNIELARRHNYPKKNFEILAKREEKCKTLIKTEREKLPGSWGFFKLSYPASKKLPFIANCLELKTSEKFGRHLVTNQPLKVGDIVSIEKPFCSVLLAESKALEIPNANIYQRCFNCLRDNAFDLLPCLSCCKGERASIFEIQDKRRF